MGFVESDTIELKRELNADIKKEIVAFLNSKGGKIYIGIEDDGKEVGINLPEHQIERLSSIIRDGIKPDATMFISNKIVNYANIEIIEIDIQRGTDRPYYIKDKGLKPTGVYVRFGNTSVPATETEIRNMIIETDGTEYENIRAFDQSLTLNYASEEFNKRQIEFGEGQKRTLGILNQDSIYTKLGLLLSDQCLHSIKIAVFDGKDKTVFKDRREFGGSLLKQLKDSFEYIDLNNRRRAVVKGLYREDKKDYSEEVVREALLNAIIHRDYSFSGSILVSLFEDRMEIVSLGGLVPGLSLDDIMLGISQSRNEKLARVFYRLRYIESYGTGIGKIKKDYKDATQKPVFSVTDNAFLLTLPNKNYKDIATEFVLEDEEKYVIQVLSTDQSITRKKVEDFLVVGQTKAGLILKNMEAKNIIYRRGKGKNTRYFLKTDNFWIP